MSASEERKRVVVIGAGAAGIAAATRLYENGITDIAVLEAENRIGGRVHSLAVENGVIEMGAQWIHGEKDNVVYDFASARKLIHDPVCSPDRNVIYVRSSGELIEQPLKNRLFELLRQRILAFECTKDEMKSFKNYGELYAHILKTEFNKKELADCVPEDLKSEFTELCHQILNSYDAADTWFNTSVTTLEEFRCSEGNQSLMWKGTGYRAVFDVLMEKCQESSDGNFKSNVIALNTSVEQISLDKYDSRSIVKCSNGRTIRADHVIITVSLGVLQETYTKLFENMPISELKIRSINNLEFGTVNKVYLEYSKPWWPKDSPNFELLWTKKDRQEYAEKGQRWVVDMFAVCVLDFAPNVLCGWVSGVSARAMEILDEKIVLETVTHVLRKFLGKKWEIPDAVRIIRSTWYSNEHFRGSYSSRSLRTDAADVSAFTLSIPVTDSKDTPVLLFAGEATSPHHYGTVHGAIESGWREADRLIQFIKEI